MTVTGSLFSELTQFAFIDAVLLSVSKQLKLHSACACISPIELSSLSLLTASAISKTVLFLS